MSTNYGEQRIEVNRQQSLADAAVRISSSFSVAKPIRSILQTVCDAAAQIVGAHMATIGMTVDKNWAHAIQAISLSDKYGAWRGYEETPNGSGIYSVVCATNRPMRLTQAELERHPAFRSFSHALERHPPLRGWLCVPLVGSDGRNLGALHLSDKYTGDFTAEDEAIALQLASMAAVAVENHVLYETVEAVNRHKTELLASLHESEEQFRTLANSIPQLAWMADSSGSIFWYNDRWLDYTGTTPEEMHGWGWKKVHHPDHVGRVVEKIGLCFEAGEIWEDTFPLRGKDGTYRWFLSRAVPIRDQQGCVVRWFGSNTDVTEQHRIEEALRETDRRKDQFLATLAHELRNPLSPIRNSVELLRMLELQNPKIQWNLDVIDRQIQQMTRLIDDLLDVSRISRGKVVLRKEHVDLATVISRAAETVQPLIEERRHRLTISIANQPLFLEVDPVRIEQVVTNLLTNAAKYTEPEGKISLTARKETGGVSVRVRDTGIGMSSDFAPHAFEMFAQAESGKDRTQGGLGIGLALVRTLVEMHGGTVSAYSAGLGQGSEFTVQLPDSGELYPEEEGTAREPRKGVRARRILVVDDHKDSAQSLAIFLRLMGNDVHTSYDGPSALEAAAVYLPEVVLLDISLPGMTGYEVARSLRSLPGLEKAVLVAVTGWGQEEDRRRCKEAGFDQHVIKPVDFNFLSKLLEGTEPI